MCVILREYQWRVLDVIMAAVEGKEIRTQDFSLKQLFDTSQYTVWHYISSYNTQDYLQTFWLTKQHISILVLEFQ